MLVVFFYVMIKMVELSSHVAAPTNEGTRRRRRRRMRRRGPKTGAAMEEPGGAPGSVPVPGTSPEADCNSNTNTAVSFLSEASSQDADFVQECQDYQWFLDYGYRESGAQHQVGLLTSLASSHGCGSSSDMPAYYEDLARNLDANLAEVDMEDFRSEDIHSILSTLPAMCCGDLQTEREGEMYASVSGSMMAKFDFDSSVSPRSGSQAEDSAGSTDTMSLCKSELLFSPVKECPLPSSNFSVDSLDCDMLTEHDIMLTCQANKDNYTIAFEGSITLYSEDSDYHEAADTDGASSHNNNWAPGCCGGLPTGPRSRTLDTSMVRSDSVYTTWSKLKKRSSEVQLLRHPSGNNNNNMCNDTLSAFHGSTVASVSTALKSQSLPNLSRHRRRCLLASLTGKVHPSALSSSVESDTRSPNTVKLYDVQHNSSSLLSETNSSVDGGGSSSSCSGSQPRKQQQQQNFSLVKLFMKQKSISNEGMCYAMDQSSASECWPASNNSQSEGDSDSYGNEPNRSRPYVSGGAASAPMINHINNSVHKASHCSLNDCDCALHTSVAICENNNEKPNANILVDNIVNNCNQQDTHTTNVLDKATNNWIQPEDATNDYSTCFEDSLAEQTCQEQLNLHGCEQALIEEEEEEGSDHSESVEQLSESVSKIEESAIDLAISSCTSEPLSLCTQMNTKVSKANIRPLARFSVNNNNSVEEHAQNSDLPDSIGMAKEVNGVLNSGAHHSTAHFMNRSVQTSTPFELVESPDGSSLLKILDPSLTPRLSKLFGNTKRPLYIFYPNYALPDLAFLNDKQKDMDMSKVFLLPQKYSSTNTKKAAPTEAGDKVTRPVSSTSSRRSQRPFSCNDMEALRKKGFSHIQDWDSLTFLLPRECRQILSEVPELVPHMKQHIAEERPLFCISPPQPRRPRPASCGDCPADIILDGKSVPNTSSSSSSTATQPSSGYRGSSTMLLTESSCQPPSQGSGLYNPLFVYRYDSVSSESSMMDGKPPTKGIPVPPLPKRSISLPASSDPKKTVVNPKLSETPPRPPLPRGILRKSLEKPSVQFNCKVHKNNTNSKRYSMFELGSKNLDYQYNNDEKIYQNKRASLQPSDYANLIGSPKRYELRKSTDKEALFSRRLASRLHSEKDIDELEDECEDEGVDAGTDTSCEDSRHFAARPPTPPLPRNHEEQDGSDDKDEVLPLEDLLQISALSALGPAAAAADVQQTGWDETQMQRLRLQVSKFLLAQQSEEDDEEDSDCHTPHNTPEHHASGCLCARTPKKSVSFAEKDQLPQPQPQAQVAPSLATLPICEEGESSPEGSSTPKIQLCRSTLQSPDALRRQGLVTAVGDAVEQIICHFSAAQNQAHCTRLGDSSSSPAVAELVLDQLCPALYAALGDGLRTTLDTAFGAIHNSVWQVVEASAQQGPMTKALNELVLRINSEDVLSEGLMKFNAFVFGLMNVRSLDAWLAYLRTRESVICRHYVQNTGLLASASTGAAARALVDQLVVCLQPLALLPFRLDLLFEARRLHVSLRRLQQLSPSPPPQPQPVSPSIGNSTSPTASRPWTLRKLVRSIQSSLTQSTDEDGSAGWHARNPKRSQTEALVQKVLSYEDTHHHPKCSGAVQEPLPDLLESGIKCSTWSSDETRPRPRSCVDGNSGSSGSNTAGSFSLVTDIASTVRKRWSGIHLGSKLFQAFDRLANEDAEEEYTDSLEPTAQATHTPVPKEEATTAVTNDSAPLSARGGKFRRLQMKWEMLSGKEGSSPSTPTTSVSPVAKESPDSGSSSVITTVRSKIPRPVCSPVRPSAIPIPAVRRSPVTDTAQPTRRSPLSNTSATTTSTPPTSKKTTVRASRSDRPHPDGTHNVRPSSLPYRPPQSASKGSTASRGAIPARRTASSSSQGRARSNDSTANRFVRTLCHRLPADSGHLSFNEGEKLRLVLEVDTQWLLCCRGDRKGLVPRSAVIETA